MRKFTILDVAAVGAISVACSAVLGAGFASQDAAKEQQSKCLKNLQHLGTAVLLYITDYDDKFPRSMNRTAAGEWRWSKSSPRESSRNLSPAHSAGWVGQLYPYFASRSVLLCPAGSISGSNPDGASYLPTSYTYNGLLHTFSAHGIVAPSKVFTIWEGTGAKYFADRYFANPQLKCDDKFNGSKCVFKADSGPAGVMYAPAGAMTIHDRGANYAFADSHAQWRRTAAQVTPASPGPPFTDMRSDPFTGYDNDGMPGWYWVQGAHPMMFRPDYDGGPSGGGVALGGTYNFERASPLPN